MGRKKKAASLASVVSANEELGPETTPKRRGRANSRRRRRTASLAPITGRDLAIEVVERRVEDPYQPGSFQAASFNRRVDVLEDEMSNSRIPTSSYLTGRIVQAVFERAAGRAGSSSWNPGNRVDAETAKELSIIRGIEDAEIVRRLVQRIERAIGEVGTRFLRSVLTGGRTMAQYAVDRGKVGERGTAQIGAHFRLLLEGLDDAFAARGRLTTELDPKFGAVSAIRADRASTGPPVETDVNGIVVPTGQGYALRDDPAARWQPRGKGTRGPETP